MSKQDLPVVIFECANAHSGDFSVLMSTIDEFSKIEYSKSHIKFQPLQADTISLSDFSSYDCYKELEFSKAQWIEIIHEAYRHFDGVWLDIFDVYGIDVLTENLSKIKGIKLQASVLFNYEVISRLSTLCISDKEMIVNVSGYDISEIENILEELTGIGVKKLILQIGFQSYPTHLDDTALQKIQILKSAFNKFEICIADHVSAEDEFACIIPLIAVSLGCCFVEKHICINRKDSKYDYYSSLEPNEMKILLNRLSVNSTIIGGCFVSRSEKKYLSNSMQIPISRKKLPKKSLISKSDLIYRRTSQVGISYSGIIEKQMNHNILSKDIDDTCSISEDCFKPARIGVIVACRMKSSRLKNKAILKINGVSSVERCLINSLKIPSANVVVLATSTTREDEVLKDYTLDGKVKFFQGEPDDVIKRYIAASDEHDIDVIIRVTADCPVISVEIAEYLLEHHFTSGADYTTARDFAVGTACEIYNAEALRRVINYLGEAKYSEYMTWYLKNNREFFKVEVIDLPSDMLRDYRLTLDYQEDLDLFQKIFEMLERDSKEATLENVFSILDNSPEISGINSHLKLKYKEDDELIKMLNRNTKINPTNH